MSSHFQLAKKLVETKLTSLREAVPFRQFDPTKPAEVEANRFYFESQDVDRLMVVLRSSGCEYYHKGGGCSMCGHYAGSSGKDVKTEHYIKQWENILDGSSFDKGILKDFDLNNYPIVCIYNLGSFLNHSEMPPEASESIFKSISDHPGVRKVIIESRAEYVRDDILDRLRRSYGGLIEVGMGLESINMEVRELCHHKNMPDLKVVNDAIKTLGRNGFKSLLYINQKPPFLTEMEAIQDAVDSSVWAYENNADAVSIEPTSLQPYTIADLLHSIGLFRVPWLWSVREVARGVLSRTGGNADLRIGGYFDEEVLSGSQGTSPGTQRNEIFPYSTSSNCDACSDDFIKGIKEFNKTRDISHLNKQEPCERCYPVWQDSIKLKDSRKIPQRIIDTLGDM